MNIDPIINELKSHANPKAIRQIGKRNPSLNKEAIALSEEILNQESSSARWIARDALKELKSEAVQSRLTSRSVS